MNPTPTSSANSTPTPSVPEFSFLSVIFLLAAPTISMVYFKRKRGKV